MPIYLICEVRCTHIKPFPQIRGPKQGHIKLFKSLRTGILESLIQYFSLNSCKLPDLAVLSYRYIILKHYYKKSLLNFFDKIVDFNEFLAVADGKLCDGGFRYLHKNRNPSSNTEEN